MFIIMCCILIVFFGWNDAHRFEKNDMVRLLEALDIPDYSCDQRTSASGIEALMMLLRRFAYPNRLCDLTSLFGRSVPELSLIISKVGSL